MQRRAAVLTWLLVVLGNFCTGPAGGQEDEAAVLARYTQAALAGGAPQQGKQVFQSQQAACAKCHLEARAENSLEESGLRRAGPVLQSVGDKLTREQLIEAVLQPSSMIHPDYGALVVQTVQGKAVTGVLHRRTSEVLELLDGESQLVRIPLEQVESEQKSPASLMPAGLHKTISAEQFADLIAYLETLRQPAGDEAPGLVENIPLAPQPVLLEPLFDPALVFDHPVWVIAFPGAEDEYLVVEQRTRCIWRLKEGGAQQQRTLFADLSGESITGEFEGVMCLAFHPRFLENGKYYVNHHVREDGVFKPVIVERQATSDRARDAGGPSRRLLEIPQTTDLHWGGMLAFGPDGYLYIGAGDGGPQEDPDGNGQHLGRLLGKILRIDVDHQSDGRPYAIPKTNPFFGAEPGVRPEIWAWGFRMPWRFSFDALTGDLWVGEIGQNLFEEVTIARAGENHGWNVFEAFTPFSDQHRRPGESFTPPVLSYRRKHGVSVTGGYVYRGARSPAWQGVYVCGDFESRRIWGLKEHDRQLDMIRQIGQSPQRIASFGVDAHGELLLVGYEGTIYRVRLEEGRWE